MKLMRVGVDLAKDVFQVHGVSRAEQPVLRRRLRREQFLSFFREQVERDCVIGMEACGGAHHWARELQKLGFSVRMMAPQHVKPYVKTNKNDLRDAEAICEAMSRPTMKFVPVKTIEQQELLAVHRIRQSLVEHRTAKTNQIRGLVAEYGIVAPKRMEVLRAHLPQWLEDAENGLSDTFRHQLHGLWCDLQELDRRVAEINEEIEKTAKTHPAARRLMSLRGIGPVSATALVAAVGDGRQFKRGRDMAVWMGLTPGQHSTGGKECMLGISKRGDSYLRTLLIHGARAVIRTAANKTDPLSLWLTTLAKRRHPNVAAVAMAHKNARIAWALLTKETDYQPDFAAR